MSSKSIIKQVFEPEMKDSYSNAAYKLLGAIVESASDKPYKQYIYENLFKPAGMRDTGTFVPKYKSENIAVGYRDDLFAHNGQINNIFEADFRRYVDEDAVLIIMTNSLHLEQSATSVSPQIAKIIFSNSKAAAN